MILLATHFPPGCCYVHNHNHTHNLDCDHNSNHDFHPDLDLNFGSDLDLNPDPNPDLKLHSVLFPFHILQQFQSMRDFTVLTVIPYMLVAILLVGQEEYLMLILA